MRIRYEVYFKDYEHHVAHNIGFFIDFWENIDFSRGRVLARKHFGTLVKDPNALFVLAKKEK